jgi:hypothetical protein
MCCDRRFLTVIIVILQSCENVKPPSADISNLALLYVLIRVLKRVCPVPSPVILCGASRSDKNDGLNHRFGVDPEHGLDCSIGVIIMFIYGVRIIIIDTNMIRYEEPILRCGNMG